MRGFLRKTNLARDPLAVAMSGVRIGERVLQIGINDARIVGALAAKAGISGHAAAVLADDHAAARAKKGAEQAGALIDVRVAPLHALPFDGSAFDVVVIHNLDGFLAALASGPRAAALRECHRVLRIGGRALAIEPGTRTGLGALLHLTAKSDPGYETAGGTTGALREAGFTAARLLADREGLRFIEGLKA